MKFSIKDFFSKCDQITFTEEILNGKLHFLCSDSIMKLSRQFRACLFVYFLFLRKSFQRKKAPNAKETTFTLLEVFASTKNCCLCCLILFCWLIFACDVLLCAQKLFVKKNKQARNCLDNIIIPYY